MSPTRPLFLDGAILGAADLTALEQLDRDRDARASRHLHTTRALAWNVGTVREAIVPALLRAAFQPAHERRPPETRADAGP